MAKQTVTLHMYESTSAWSAGAKEVWQTDFRTSNICMKDRIWLGQVDVEIDFPEIDTRQLQIDALEQQIQQERADSEVRVNLLLDRISKLRAIAHEGE
jgi:hypothetical protein